MYTIRLAILQYQYTLWKELFLSHIFITRATGNSKKHKEMEDDLGTLNRHFKKRKNNLQLKQICEKLV